MRKQGSDKWEKFSSRRRFVKVIRAQVRRSRREETQGVFVEPYMVNPWKNKSYNSLEAFFE